jgi:hypothetical protein
MKIRQLFTFAAGLALIATAILFWPRSVDKTPSLASADRSTTASPVDSATVEESQAIRRPRRERSQEPSPWKASPDVIALYSRLAEEGNPHSDLSIFYEREGFLNYYGLMRDALRGDQAALAGIFDSPLTDGSASESFSIGVAKLLEELGDRYFAYQLSKQNPEIQRRIINAIWRGKFNEIANGEVPTLGNQTCPATGQLAQKIKKQNKAEMATPRKPSD